MYTKEYDPESGNWTILDPDGDPLLPPYLFEEDADVLLSHLNRSM